MAPLNRLTRIFWKLFVGPFKYRGKGSYDAEKYWRDRHHTYSTGYRGSGNEALSEEENERLYQENVTRFRAICAEHGITLGSGTRLLEIGCGNGVYTRVCRETGVTDYTGIDITDELFAALGDQYPGYRFVKADATGTMDLDPGYDAILMIDVIEHIVAPEKLAGAMANARRLLNPGGVFLVSPVMDSSRKRMFYVRSWSEPDLVQHFPGWRVERTPFRDGRMLILRPPRS